MITDFGFAPGILDYWILLSDWRNGSFAILLALSVIFVGYVRATGDKNLAVKDPRPVEGIDPSARSSSTPKRPPSVILAAEDEGLRNLLLAGLNAV